LKSYAAFVCKYTEKITYTSSKKKIFKKKAGS